MSAANVSGANGVFEIVPGKNDRNEPIFSVVVKRTYQIKPGAMVQRCEADHELRKIDQYYDNGVPEWATVQYESELAPYKPSVDVVVIGKAYAPRGVATAQMTVSVRIGTTKKSIIVFGDRSCEFREDKPPLFTEPQPFTEMELRYERAYGGKDLKSVPDIPFYYARNFMGTGIVLKNLKDVVQGLALPNLEDPTDLLTPERLILEEPERWPHQPLPQGFGWFSPTWYPRCCWAGTYPAYLDVETVTQEERLGLLPAHHMALAKQWKLPSFSARFHNGASVGLMCTELKNDETLRLEGLSPNGPLEFSLPGETPTIILDIGKGEQQLVAKLDTVSIRPDDLELDLIWRGVCVYEGYSWLPQMKRLHAEVH